jgi:hypothetical protein
VVGDPGEGTAVKGELHHHYVDYNWAANEMSIKPGQMAWRV